MIGRSLLTVPTSSRLTVFPERPHPWPLRGATIGFADPLRGATIGFADIFSCAERGARMLSRDNGRRGRLAGREVLHLGGGAIMRALGADREGGAAGDLARHVDLA